MAKEDRANGTGYAKGRNLEEDGQPSKKKRRTNTKKTDDNVNKTCNKCGNKGHSRTTSKKCPLNKNYVHLSVESVHAMLDDGKEQDLLDKIGFETQEDNDVAEDLLELQAEDDEEEMNKII